MDDPGWTWPAWKFGMKREELFTKLHDQYNTITSTIQDPEAFHHDVYEISNVASDPAEFHSLLADRKQQRLDELNKSLESASFEIIANPDLIGTEQWKFAVQLFQTKSLDSLVRYFGSYLPECHPWHRPADNDSAVDVYSAPASSADEDDYQPAADEFEVDYEYGHITENNIITQEPEEIPFSSDIASARLPISPKSMTMCSDGSTAVSSSIEDAQDQLVLKTLTPARTMSFSDSDADIMTFSSSSLLRDDGIETSQYDDAETPITASDKSDAESISDYEKEPITPASQIEFANDIDFKTSSETPTPQNKPSSDSYLSVIDERESTHPYTSDAHTFNTKERRSTPSIRTHLLQEYAKSSARRSNHGREGSPSRQASRRSSPETGRGGRIVKPSNDSIGSKPKVRASRGPVHIL